MELQQSVCRSNYWMIDRPGRPAIIYELLKLFLILVECRLLHSPGGAVTRWAWDLRSKLSQGNHAHSETLIWRVPGVESSVGVEGQQIEGARRGTRGRARERESGGRAQESERCRVGQTNFKALWHTVRRRRRQRLRSSSAKHEKKEKKKKKTEQNRTETETENENEGRTVMFRATAWKFSLLFLGCPARDTHTATPTHTHTYTPTEARRTVIYVRLSPGKSLVCTHTHESFLVEFLLIFSFSGLPAFTVMIFALFPLLVCCTRKKSCGTGMSIQPQLQFPRLSTPKMTNKSGKKECWKHTHVLCVYHVILTVVALAYFFRSSSYFQLFF